MSLQINAWIAAQPEPRPSRSEAIRRLLAQALGKSVGEAAETIARSFGSRNAKVDRQEIVDTLKRVIDAHAKLAIFAPHLKLAMRERLWEHDRIFAGGTPQGPASLHAFIHENYPVGIGASYELVESLISGDAETLATWNAVKSPSGGNRQTPASVKSPALPPGRTLLRRRLDLLRRE